MKGCIPQLVLRTSPFIVPAQPALRLRPPVGDAWLHEVKFDGYRCQPHKAGEDAVIFSKNGRDFSNRFPGIRDALVSLPCRSAIIVFSSFHWAHFTLIQSHLPDL
jgi:ATP-dependent DNA ligase